MNEMAKIPQPQQYAGSSGVSALTLELAKMLILVAPTSMSTEQQEIWLRAAVDALEDIRADELRAVSAELRRTVTRPNQIVPEIAKLVAAKRARASAVSPDLPASPECGITREAQARRGRAHGRDEVEAAWQWERDARIAAGLHVKPIAKPFNQRELDTMSREMISLGLKHGFLKREDGKLVEA